MELLAYYHQQRLVTDHYIPRKCQALLKDKSEEAPINLFGARGSGKTALILDLIHKEEDKQSILYIDLDDPNLIFSPLELISLQQFIDKEKITLLVLDHYRPALLPDFPSVQKLIVLSRIPLNASALLKVELFPLDYEEFLAFESNASHNSGLNHFLRSGTLPLLARSHKMHTQSMKTFLHSAFDESELHLLLVLSQHHAKHISTHQLYAFAKEKFKISKDWLYKSIKAFTDEKLIFFIEDRYQKSGKKMLLFDFAFAKYLSINQPFMMQFDSMIALALIKHGIHVQTLGIHGYVTAQNELIIPAPFENEETLWVKSQNKFSLYKKYNIQKVTIVTIANTYEFVIEKVHFEALPFDEWSVIHDEE
ncbi:MAG TPA: AAA family ATPase [Sulfurovum sp.]|jgi:predicted AAA+ superfamily ATPase|nr:MAG: hypothetical protein B7Y63_07275 [Sulfurovum sp. 35-42-20]OYZ24445.1 MAG: hypothetical protein B7Y23_08830 [Sulfurovum sp. 16-42-52]OYZ48356.1 MAG: hypothetical protein B7Y13_07945 [Sulfurovum sp. 24-42-9]OZA44242.1 MAG: hypothetical protein B7X80_08110 [Sulfurovum sp. 17-42-90]OZA61193.1 MAG: hypothetical protein B7X69_01110 [Sulfurovum sp. 39-42-12]HQR73023.1 AAA family ATPase [Sulfurovum sp.]